jgi:hypothetical protein
MTTLKKISILSNELARYTYEVQEFQDALLALGVESSVAMNLDDITDYQPDCVITTSLDDPKLTPFPTFGLINTPKAEYLELPRYVRNSLTYDGVFIQSKTLAQTFKDIKFGARKLSGKITDIDFHPMKRLYKSPDFSKNRIIIFEPNYDQSEYKTCIKKLLAAFNNIFLLTNACSDNKIKSDKVLRYKNYHDVDSFLSESSFAIVLDPGYDGVVKSTLIKSISHSLVVITRANCEIEALFGESLYYIPNEANVNSVVNFVGLFLKKIQNNLIEATIRVKKAHEIFMSEYALNNKLELFINHYKAFLIDSGYLPSDDAEKEKLLPSVTYIMRTGGKHRPFLERALDSLVSQKYPKLHVIFVTHVKVPFINEIIAAYPSIQFKVIESIKSRRSEAIRDGMAAVETDLFGLFDDDDELFPNHVRSLVRALNYHQNRDWRGEISMVYSGSIHADDTYPVPEHHEFRDDRVNSKNEKKAIEHFRFYNSFSMSHHEWYMPNGWLARAKMIDEEILDDPALDTCEDLYFELQFAQRGHLAFSAEVTAVHHFHHLGNSTIDDSHKHVPDTQRIALRNFSRTFPRDSIYDISDRFRLIGVQASSQEWVSFKDAEMVSREVNYLRNQFYPERIKSDFGVQHHAPIYFSSKRPFSNTLIKLIKLPFKLAIYSLRFVKLNTLKKREYIKKFKTSVSQTGLINTLLKLNMLVETGQIAGVSGGISNSLLMKPIRKIINIISFGIYSKS